MNWTTVKAHLKGALRSFTIWFNALMAIAVTALPVAQDSFPQLQDYLPTNLYHWAMGALIVGNLLLRVKTNCSLAEKGQK